MECNTVCNAYENITALLASRVDLRVYMAAEESETP